MLLSARASAVVLDDLGTARAQARLLLTAGLAGAPVSTSSGPMYDGRRVRELADRAVLRRRDVDAACPDGLFVARLARARAVDVSAGWEELAEQLRIQPAMSELTLALLRVRIAAQERLPWVATLCGHVILCADATAVVGTGPATTDPALRTDPGTEFTLSRPGAWSESLADRRLPSPRGGRPGLLWLPPP